MTDKLRRSSTNRIIAGICGGLGEYFNIDPTIVRLVFVVLTIWGGLSILIYISLFIIMPESGSGPIKVSDTPRRHMEMRHWIGGGLILFGAVMLADTINNVYGVFPSLQLSSVVWPLVVIYLGVWFLYSQRNKQ